MATSSTTDKRSPYYQEIASSNPSDVTAIRGQEVETAKLACALRMLA